MIYLNTSAFVAMTAHARVHLPEEACGLIAGTVSESGDKFIQKVYYLENVDHSPEHFTICPQDQLSAVKDMRRNGFQLLGNWHSHPQTPARPSEEDIRLAHDSKASYLILSLSGSEPILNAYHIADGQAEREPIRFV